MFIAALFIIGKIWKQSVCPSTDEQIKKIYYTHTQKMEYYSAKEKNENLPTATAQMDLEGIMLSEITQILCYHLYVESFKRYICQTIINQ